MERKGWDRARSISLKKRITVVFVVLVIGILVSWIVFTNPFGITDVKVVVEYDHHWTGNIGELDVMNGLNETGNYSHLMHKTFGGKWNVYIDAQKEDNSTDILKISIETLDGKVLKSAMTSIPYETVFVEVIL